MKLDNRPQKSENLEKCHLGLAFLVKTMNYVVTLVWNASSIILYHFCSLENVRNIVKINQKIFIYFKLKKIVLLT